MTLDTTPDVDPDEVSVDVDETEDALVEAVDDPQPMQAGADDRQREPDDE